MAIMPILSLVYSILIKISFLMLKPSASFITVPLLEAIEIVQVILESIRLRREKNMCDNFGKRIVELLASGVTIDLQLRNKRYTTASKRNFRLAQCERPRGQEHVLAMLVR
jgi:DNA repair protein RAD5